MASALPQQAGNIRALSIPQVVLAATILQLESLRAEACRPSSMLSYFRVEGISNGPMFDLLVAIADQVSSRWFAPKGLFQKLTLFSHQVGLVFIRNFGDCVTRHAIPPIVFQEIRQILLECCHPAAKVRSVSLKYLNELLSSFPSLSCDSEIVTVLLEILTVLRRACQTECLDEVRSSSLSKNRNPRFLTGVPLLPVHSHLYFPIDTGELFNFTSRRLHRSQFLAHRNSPAYSWLAESGHCPRSPRNAWSFAGSLSSRECNSSTYMFTFQPGLYRRRPRECLWRDGNRQ